MHVEWYGQSAFRLTDGSTTVFIDPFPDMTPMAERGMRWDYPPIAGVEADLVLVTHERIDFLDPVGPFVQRAARAERLSSQAFDLEALPAADTPLVVVPAAP
jgi:L-ascorbate metabolism protein UlaG (beta-lactamase superfamily)